MSQSIQELIGKINAQGSDAERRRSAARLMTMLEDDPGKIVALIQVSGGVVSRARLIVGITGPSGSGKSTLTDALVSEYRKRNPEGAIGVLAVDPSSPFTGGAILGDRIRMMKHATDPGVFIRSLASRGHLGGLSMGTSGVSRVMQILGCDPVIIETVGVGQNEVEILQQADLVLVVQSPGAGDSTQMLKAGLLEIGDVFVLNKSDLPGADELQSQLRGMIEMQKECGTARAPVLAEPVSAHLGTGVSELVDLMESLAEARQEAWKDRREKQARDEVVNVVREAAAGILAGSLDATDILKRVLEEGQSVDAVSLDLVTHAADEMKSHHEA